MGCGQLAAESSSRLVLPLMAYGFHCACSFVCSACLDGLDVFQPISVLFPRFENTDVAVNRTRVPRFPCLRPAYCMVCIPCLGRVQSPIQERRTAAVSGTRGGLWPVVGWRLWRFFRKTNETTPVPRFRQMTDQVTSGGGWDPLGSLSTAAAEPTPRCLSWDDPALEVCPLCFQPTVNAFA